MAVTTLISDRAYSGRTYAVLNGTATDMNGDQSLPFELPATFGDCLIYACHASVGQMATIAASIDLLGVRFYITDSTGSAVDVIFSTRWSVWGGTAAAGTSIMCGGETDYPRLWRSQESVRVGFAEVDTNASPTADLNVYFDVIRLRST